MPRFLVKCAFRGPTGPENHDVVVYAGAPERARTLGAEIASIGAGMECTACAVIETDDEDDGA